MKPERGRAERCQCTSVPANPNEDNFLPVYTRNPKCPIHGDATPVASTGTPAGMDFWWEKFWQDEAAREQAPTEGCSVKAACEFAQWFAQQCEHVKRLLAGKE